MTTSTNDSGDQPLNTQVPKSSNARKSTTEFAVPDELVNNAPPLAKAILEFCNLNLPLSTSIIKLNSKFSKGHIEELADYLGFDVKPLADGKKQYKNLPLLIHRCLLRLKSFLPATCGACKERYTVDNKKVPLFRCWMCSQGSHDCETMERMHAAVYSISHITMDVDGYNHDWTCCECKERHDLSLMSKVPVLAKTEETKEVTDVNNEGEIREESHNDEVQQDQNVTNKSPCMHLAKGRCRHGMSGKKEVDGKVCPFLHRRVCRKYKTHGLHSRHGCKQGKNCTKLHPKLCEGSQRKMKERLCVKEDCPHLHLKGTRRTPLSQDRNGQHTRQASETTPRLPISSSPPRPVSQQNPDQLQSGFLSIVLKEVRNAREESLRQADRMEEIMSQLGATHDDSLPHPQIIQTVHPQPVHYTLPGGMMLTQGAHRQTTAQIQQSRRSSY